MTPESRRDLVRAAAAAAVVFGALAPLTRTFTDESWRPATIGAVLVALAIAAGARRLRFGAVAAAVTSLIGLAVQIFVVHLPPADTLLPGALQWQQTVELLRTALVQIREQPAPTAPLDGLVFLTTTGTWVVTHLTHELLTRWRRPGLALIAPATLWIVPLAVPMPPGRTWPQALPFLAGAGLVLLLESDADVAGWVADTAGPRWSNAGAIVGCVALVVAAIAPALLPGYQEPPWWDLGAGDDPRGYQPIVDVGDRLKLPTQRDILEVRSDRRVYLRLAALDTFDGNTWRLGPPGDRDFRPDAAQLFPADEPLPPEAAIAEQEEVAVDVAVLDLENIYVPVPYQPVRIGGPADEMVYSLVGGFVATGELSENEIGGDLRVGVTEGFRYQVQAVLPDPTYEQLQDVRFDDPALSRWTSLPGPYDAVRDLAEDVYAAAGADTVIERVFAVQDHFAGPDSEFRYSLDVPDLRGDQALQDFLFETQTGYCEYFATAMAVMLRATGIPARVAVGFLPGRVTDRPDPSSGEALTTYTIASDDAHAWVEVLFPSYGWVRFEPTPRSDGATMPPFPGDFDPVQTLAEQRGDSEVPLPGEEDIPEDDSNPGRAGEETETPEEPPATGGGSVRGLPLEVVALTLVLAAAAGLVLAARRRTHLGAGDGAAERVIAAQRRLHATARRLGVPRRPSETAVEAAVRWVAEGRLDEHEALRLALLAQAAAFGGDATAEDAAEAEQLTDRLTEQLGGSVDRRARIVAPLRDPARSTAAAARGAVARARELVGASLRD